MGGFFLNEGGEGRGRNSKEEKRREEKIFVQNLKKRGGNRGGEVKKKGRNG